MALATDLGAKNSSNELPEHKKDFIAGLRTYGALKVGGDFTLKSKRVSPYFVNVGDFNEGTSTAFLGDGYAHSIKDSGIEFNLIYGIPEKGVALAPAAAMGLARLDRNVPWFFTRKMPKEYGEATGSSKADKRKTRIVGKIPESGQSIIMADDVFTTGDAKYEAIETLKELLDEPKIAAVAIAVDRQEVGIDGKSAIEKFTEKTGIPVTSIVNASDILRYLREMERNMIADSEREEDHRNEVQLGIVKMENYMRVYGTKTARDTALESTDPMTVIVERDKSIIPACDVSLEKFIDLVKKTDGIEGIGGFKIPATSGRKGWEQWVNAAGQLTNKPLIYDHQKFGNDVPDTSGSFIKELKDAGFDAFITFPHSGPEEERAILYNALNVNMDVIVGGWMTHPAYAVSEGGWITDEGILDIYRIAANAGVNNFVVPGNKPEAVQKIRKVVEEEVGVKKPVYFAPGFVAQGGSISDAAKVAGDRWHAIVGRGIYGADDMHTAALGHVNAIKASEEATAHGV